MVAAHYLVVGFDNITNPTNPNASNWPFVQGVLSGDGVQADGDRWNNAQKLTFLEGFLGPRGFLLRLHGCRWELVHHVLELEMEWPRSGLSEFRDDDHHVDSDRWCHDWRAPHERQRRWQSVMLDVVIPAIQRTFPTVLAH